MNIEMLEAAAAELDEAFDYYNKQSEGLGFAFAAEIRHTIDRIIQIPPAWTKLSTRTRRCRTRKFPYGVIYQIRDDDEILIVAITHLRRHPDYWKSRLKEQ